jgi:hypothetical protein
VNAHHETVQPTLPLTIGDHQDNQSAQDLSVDRLVKFEQNQIAEINMDIAAIYERIASLELPNSKAKPESINHLYKMIARLTTHRAEHVQAIQQRRSVQFASKQIKSETPSQDVRKKEKEHKESDGIQQMAIPDPVVSQVISQEPVVTHDRFGNPLSACGLPLTLWNPTIHATGNRSNCPTHPLPMGNGGYHGGGNNDDDGDDYYGGGGRRRAKEIILLILVAPVVLLMIQWTQEKKAKKMLSNVRW